MTQDVQFQSPDAPEPQIGGAPARQAADKLLPILNTGRVRFALNRELDGLGLEHGERTERPALDSAGWDAPLSLVRPWDLSTAYDNAVNRVLNELLAWRAGHGPVGDPLWTAVYKAPSYLWLAVLDEGSKRAEPLRDLATASASMRLLKHVQFWNVYPSPEHEVRAAWALMLINQGI